MAVRYSCYRDKGVMLSFGSEVTGVEVATYTPRGTGVHGCLVYGVSIPEEDRDNLGGRDMVHFVFPTNEKNFGYGSFGEHGNANGHNSVTNLDVMVGQAASNKKFEAPESVTFKERWVEFAECICVGKTDLDDSVATGNNDDKVLVDRVVALIESGACDVKMSF